MEIIKVPPIVKSTGTDFFEASTSAPAFFYECVVVLFCAGIGGMNFYVFYEMFRVYAAINYTASFDL